MDLSKIKSLYFVLSVTLGEAGLMMVVLCYIPCKPDLQECAIFLPLTFLARIVFLCAVILHDSC